MNRYNLKNLNVTFEPRLEVFISFAHSLHSFPKDTPSFLPILKMQVIFWVFPIKKPKAIVR